MVADNGALKTKMSKRTIPTISQGTNPQDPDLDCLGPNWSEMTSRQQHLYAFSRGLTQAEMDKLWDEHEGDADAAA